jgi:hypothetical protein
MTSINPLKEMHYFSIAVLSTAIEITILFAFSAARANLPKADKAGGESTKNQAIFESRVSLWGVMDRHAQL